MQSQFNTYHDKLLTGINAARKDDTQKHTRVMYLIQKYEK